LQAFTPDLLARRPGVEYARIARRIADRSVSTICSRFSGFLQRDAVSSRYSHAILSGVQAFLALKSLGMKGVASLADVRCPLARQDPTPLFVPIRKDSDSREELKTERLKSELYREVFLGLRDFDPNVVTFHFDLMGRRGMDGRHGHGLARTNIEPRPMPRADDLKTLDVAFAQRPAVVRAGVFNRKEVAIEMKNDHEPIVHLEHGLAGIGNLGCLADADKFGHITRTP
jgi:hypothetical protein